jgi:hypothetical protein
VVAPDTPPVIKIVHLKARVPGWLVDSYLESSRTIILAVIPATSDAETQTIIQRARHFDKDGIRTIGGITKPDLINKGTEERVARLAKNLDHIKLRHGFFLMKNPSSTELADGLEFEAWIRTLEVQRVHCATTQRRDLRDGA